MDITAYRKQCLDAVEQEQAAVDAYRTARGAPGDDPAAQIASLSLEPDQFDASVRTALAILADEGVASGIRLAAMSHIDAAAFQPSAFAPFNAAHVALLRKLATDKDKGVRQAVIERLALSNDRYAQKLLREGLEGSRRALVPRAKAAQLLGHDDHGSARSILRTLATSSKGQVREEALRALSTDAKSASLFESITADKGEGRAIRQIAALGLRHASPSRFAKVAKAIVLDDDDDDRLRASAMAAIAHTEDIRVRLAKPQFTKAIEAVGANTKSRMLKASIGRFRKIGSGQG